MSLHYYAPVCAVINMFIIPFTEGLEPFYALHRVGLLVLFSNAGLAFALNVAAVFLISVGSGLILTLAGVLKDIVSRCIRPALRAEARLTRSVAAYFRVGPGVRIAHYGSAGLWVFVSLEGLFHMARCTQSSYIWAGSLWLVWSLSRLPVGSRVPGSSTESRSFGRRDAWVRLGDYRWDAAR